MTSLHGLLARPSSRKPLQAVAIGAWLLLVGIVVWADSPGVTKAAAIASALFGLAAAKGVLIEAATLTSLDAEFRRVRRRQEELEAAIRDQRDERFRDADHKDLRQELTRLSNLLEPYAAMVEVLEQENLALRERLDQESVR